MARVLNSADISSAGGALTINLGDAATLNVGTGNDTVAAGDDGRFEAVNTQTQTAIDAKANTLDTYNVQAGTTYTLQPSDLGKTIRCTNASGCTVTGPNSIIAGFNCLILQKGAAQVTFLAGSGATVGAWPASAVKTAGLNAYLSVSVESNAGSNAAYVVGGGVV